MDTIERVDIIFDDEEPFFKAGSRVTGNVTFVTMSTVTLDSVIFIVFGETSTSWVNKHSEKIFESTLCHYSISKNLLSGTGSKCRPGKQSVPFNFIIPVDAPSTFDGEYGRVYYYAKATLVKPKGPELPFLAHTLIGSNIANSVSQSKPHDIQKVFSVRAHLSLFSYAMSRIPMISEDRSDFSLCCCISMGYVKATLRLPRSGFIPGQSILMNGLIENKTRRTLVNHSISIIQIATFTASSRYENVREFREMKYTIDKVERQPIQQFSQQIIKNELMRVPSVPPTFRGEIIDIKYILRLEAAPGIELEVPLVIGTIDVDMNKQWK